MRVTTLFKRLLGLDGVRGGGGGGGSRPPAAALASVSALRLSHARLLRPLAAHAPSPGRAADGVLRAARGAPARLPALRRRRRGAPLRQGGEPFHARLRGQLRPARPRASSPGPRLA